ncbi:hypothetical protein EOM39_01235 [Candidatus Gracilibacteria bacterium]|nr:hypothetical protein [Candidatus Gracilibacteria bacterium]
MRKDTHILLKISTQQKELLKQRAKELNMSLSSFLILGGMMLVANNLKINKEK